MSDLSPLNRPDIWTDAVATYEARAEPQTRSFARIALDYADGAAPGVRVLDVATGTGALTLGAAADGAEVRATDFSPSVVERLARCPTEGGFARCEALVMDGQALDLPRS